MRVSPTVQRAPEAERGGRDFLREVAWLGRGTVPKWPPPQQFLAGYESQWAVCGRVYIRARKFLSDMLPRAGRGPGELVGRRADL